MQHYLLIAFCFFYFSFSSLHASIFDNHDTWKNNIETSTLQKETDLINKLGLEDKVDKKGFEEAVTGYYKIGNKQKPLLTYIDFTKPSTEDRLYVIDMQNEKILYSSVVSHGRNSGENYATSFSNVSGSHKSSLGFYLTEHTYSGKNGYSLRLEGLEKGINDNAMQRAIVVHGAAYANPNNITSGRLGRSLGCPALPLALYIPIIDTIKDGSVLFIYANDSSYHSDLAQS